MLAPSTPQKHAAREWRQDLEGLRQDLLPSPRCEKCPRSDKTWGKIETTLMRILKIWIIMIKHNLNAMPSSEIFFCTSLSSSRSSPSSPRPFLLPASNIFFKYLQWRWIEHACQHWEPPGGFRVHVLGLFQFAEGHDPLKGVFRARVRFHVHVLGLFQLAEGQDSHADLNLQV